MNPSFDLLVRRLAFRHFRLVLGIVEEGSLAGAAMILNLTQPAVTKSLRELEVLLDVELFERTNRGVVPTMYGNVLIAHARLVMAQLSHAAEEINDLRDATGGRITVGTLIAASAGILPKAIIQLRKDRPKLIISVLEGTSDLLLPALRHGELDLVVGRLPAFPEQTDLVQEILFQDIAVIVVRSGHPLVGRGGLTLSDLVDCHWILPRHETVLRQQFDDAFREQELPPPPYAIESVSFLMNRELLVGTDYLGVWPWQAAQRDSATGQIAVLPIILPTTISSIGITVRANGRLPPAAKVLVENLHSVACEMAVCPFLERVPPAVREKSCNLARIAKNRK